MKRICSTLIIGALILVLAGLSSCRKTRPVALPEHTGAIEIAIPFSGSRFRNSQTHFRAVQTASSPNIAGAKQLALHRAKQELAGNIESIMRAVSDNYTQQRDIANVIEFSNKFESLSREVTNQQLRQVNIIDEKLFQEKDGNFTMWVAIEVPVKPLLLELENSISRNQTLRQDYDKMMFERIFNEEMKKLEQQRP